MALKEANSLVSACKMTESIKDFIHIVFFMACVIASCFYAFNMTSFL